MPQERFFIPTELEQGSLLTLDKEEAHHIRVMRLRPGDMLEVINGSGALAKAELIESGKDKALLRVVEAAHFEKEKHRLTLLQALTRPNRLDTILEKATELGATEIVLFPGERSEKKELSAQQMQRAQSILIAATKQCGRLYIPQLTSYPPIGSWKPLEGRLLFGDVRQGIPTLLEEMSKEGPKDVSVCIGPEAGLSEKEHRLLMDRGFSGVSLHRNILRADTAPIAALAVISQFLF